MGKLKCFDILFIVIAILSIVLAVYGVFADEKISPVSAILSNLTILMLWIQNRLTKDERK